MTTTTTDSIIVSISSIQLIEKPCLLIKNKNMILNSRFATNNPHVTQRPIIAT
jgi:hypothetical protein